MLNTHWNKYGWWNHQTGIQTVGALSGILIALYDSIYYVSRYIILNIQTVCVPQHPDKKLGTAYKVYYNVYMNLMSLL